MARVKRGTKRRATSQEVFKAHKRLFPNQEQVVPIRSGSGESRGSLCVSRPARQETAVPAIVDSTRGSSGAIERVDVRPADSRIEDGRSVTLDRKVLADIAVKDAAGFAALAETARAAAPPVKKAKAKK